MVEATHIGLGDTQVSGDVGAWALLTQATEVVLRNTAVMGDLAGWQLLTHMVTARLENTAVSGNVTSWSALQSLTYLDLNGTAVCEATVQCCSSSAAATSFANGKPRSCLAAYTMSYFKKPTRRASLPARPRQTG